MHSHYNVRPKYPKIKMYVSCGCTLDPRTKFDYDLRDLARTVQRYPSQPPPQRLRWLRPLRCRCLSEASGYQASSQQQAQMYPALLSLSTKAHDEGAMCQSSLSGRPVAGRGRQTENRTDVSSPVQSQTGRHLKMSVIIRPCNLIR